MALLTENIIATPWDAPIFGIETFELLDLSEETLAQVLQKPGHYTVKVDPLSSKEILHRHGFYYCDTLIVPHCQRQQLKIFAHPQVSIAKSASFDELAGIIPDSFHQARFHRDFNIAKSKADARYIQWLKQLFDEQSLFVFSYQNVTAGFFAYSGHKILLHALNQKFRGKGLAKYFWSLACQKLFDQGHTEIQSSISPASMPTLNLYASLGFRFKDSIDIYHRLVK